MTVNKHSQRGRIRPLPRGSDRGLRVNNRSDNSRMAVQPESKQQHFSKVTPIYAASPIVSSKRPVQTSHKQLWAKTPESVDMVLAAVEQSLSEVQYPEDIVKENTVRVSSAWPKLAFGMLLLLVLSMTGYVGYYTLDTNSKVQQALASPMPSGAVKTNPTAAASKDSADRSSATSVQAYKVAPSLPRAILIPRLNVSAIILPMGTNSDKSIQVPTNIYEAGWYNASAKPGKTGAMLIDGHSSETGTHYGLFGYLTDLNVGDQIIIERGDGAKFTYKVAHTEIDALSKVNMSKLMSAYGNANQGVNLISCTGKWTKDNATLDHRIIVNAVLVGAS